MNRSWRASLLFLLVFALFPAGAHADVGSWLEAGSLSVPRYGAMTARLGDGSVLIAGGINDNTEVYSSTERFDPATNRWSPAAPMASPRAFAPAITLQDGRLLVPGGRFEPYHATNTAEVFDPKTGAWSSAGTMNRARSLHTGVLLDDGRALIIGGDEVSDREAGAEIWDPRTNTWTLTAPMAASRSNPVAARLADGSVVVAGGWSGGYLATVELYHPDTNTWTETAPMTEPRLHPGVAGLPDGRVLVAGGHGWVDMHPTVSRTSEIYDPCTGVWSPAAALNSPRGEGLAMTTLTDGRPVVSGGFWWTVVNPSVNGELPTWGGERYENTAEVYDPVLGTWTQSPPMARGRSGHFAVALTDDTLLVGGGYAAGTLAERFVPGPAAPVPTPAATPVPTSTATPTATPPPAMAVAASASPKRPTLAAFLSRLPKHLTVSKKGTITFRLRCSGPGACLDHLELRLRGGEVLGRTRLRIPHGQAATIRLRLSKAAVRKLGRKSTKVTLALTSRHISVKATAARAR